MKRSSDSDRIHVLIVAVTFIVVYLVILSGLYLGDKAALQSFFWMWLIIPVCAALFYLEKVEDTHEANSATKKQIAPTEDQASPPREPMLPQSFLSFLETQDDHDMFDLKLDQGLVSIPEIHKQMDFVGPEKAEQIAMEILKGFRYRYHNIPPKYRTRAVTYMAIKSSSNLDEIIEATPNKLKDEEFYVVLAGERLGWPLIPSDKITEKVLEAKIRGGLSYANRLEDVPDSAWTNHAAHLCAEQGKLDAIPERFKTEIIYRKAVKASEANLAKVPFALFQELFEPMFEKNPKLIFYIGDRATPDLIKRAVTKNPGLVKWHLFKDEWYTHEIAMISWKLGHMRIPEKFQNEIMARQMLSDDTRWPEVAGKFWKDSDFHKWFLRDKTHRDQYEWGSSRDWREGEQVLRNIKEHFHDKDLFTFDRMKFVLSEPMFPYVYADAENMCKDMLVRLIEVLMALGREDDIVKYLAENPGAALKLGMTPDQMNKCGIVA